MVTVSSVTNSFSPGAMNVTAGALPLASVKTSLVLSVPAVAVSSNRFGSLSGLPSGPNAVTLIVDIELHKVRERLGERGLKLVLSDDAKEFVINKSRSEGDREHTDYGARPLRRAVEMYIEDPLSEELLRGEFDGKNVIRITVKEVGDDKQLEFSGQYEEGSEPAGEPALVGAAAEGDAAPA